MHAYGAKDGSKEIGSSICNLTLLCERKLRTDENCYAWHSNNIIEAAYDMSRQCKCAHSAYFCS